MWICFTIIRNLCTGIDNTPSARHQFTYTEKKAICAATLELAARRIVQPAIDFMRERKRREQSSAAFSTFQLERTQVELLVAEKARQQLQTNLMDAELARLELLQRAVNLRHSASMAAEMDLLFRRLQLSCEKVGSVALCVWNVVIMYQSIFELSLAFVCVVC